MNNFIFKSQAKNKSNKSKVEEHRSCSFSCRLKIDFTYIYFYNENSISNVRSNLNARSWDTTINRVFLQNRACNKQFLYFMLIICEHICLPYFLTLHYSFSRTQRNNVRLVFLVPFFLSMYLFYTSDFMQHLRRHFSFMCYH